MKKIYNKLPLFILLALSLQGCAKLDQEPYVDLSDEKAYLNVEDAQYWVNGMYRALRDNTYGNAMISTDIQADFTVGGILSLPRMKRLRLSGWRISRQYRISISLSRESLLFQ